MTSSQLLDAFLVLVPILAAAYLAMLAWVSLSRGRRLTPAVQAEMENALAAYLCGSRELGALRALADAHPGHLCEMLLAYQVRVAARREELCELAMALGFVDRWLRETRSATLARRRTAFVRIATVAHHQPVFQKVRELACKASRDTDGQIRLNADRILLAGGRDVDITHVFEAAMMETSGIRSALAGELRLHAVALCENAIQWALRRENPLDILKILASWERALPLTDVGSLAKHPDRAVRLETMRLLRYLPATTRNQEALQHGLASQDAEIREAAAAAVQPGPADGSLQANHFADTAGSARWMDSPAPR
ncbi:MAG: hypothetical protein P4L56_11140 [Candidatus Sulfopaludibacter sp.]|nr:hypothetical protein [Candidatus Sulfopaludibacter sp.]